MFSTTTQTTRQIVGMSSEEDWNETRHSTTSVLVLPFSNNGTVCILSNLGMFSKPQNEMECFLCLTIKMILHGPGNYAPPHEEDGSIYNRLWQPLTVFNLSIWYTLSRWSVLVGPIGEEVVLSLV